MSDCQIREQQMNTSLPAVHAALRKQSLAGVTPADKQTIFSPSKTFLGIRNAVACILMELYCLDTSL